MSKYWLPTTGATEIKITPAQWAAAINWMDRQQDEPDRPRHIQEVFPERDNWANGQRRCCRRLVEAGILHRDGDKGYILPPQTRAHLDRYRYRYR